MDAETVVRKYWDRIAARDWDGVRDLLDDSVEVDWPVTRERLVGADAVVAVNREYPEGWSIHVLRVVASGEHAVSEVEVPMDGAGIFRAASFWTVLDGRISSGTEYWTGLGQEQAPTWRSRLVERY